MSALKSNIYDKRNPNVQSIKFRYSWYSTALCPFYSYYANSTDSYFNEFHCGSKTIETLLLNRTIAYHNFFHAFKTK